MGWAIGAGLTFLPILVLSALCAILTICRFAFRSDGTPIVAICLPLIACCIGVFGVVALRVVSPPTGVYEFVAIGTLLIVVVGFLAGCVPARK